MIFLPVTRTWSLDRVMAALNASDIPRDVILLADAPDCLDIWWRAFIDNRWSVKKHIYTGNPEPPSDRFERRARHRAMRRLSQEMVEEYKERPILFIEDDTLVPPTAWSNLNALLKMGFLAASGVQVGRHGQPLYGVWHKDISGAYDPMVPPDDPHYDIEQVDAVGHYCLLAPARLYAHTPLPTDDSRPVDVAHTALMPCIGVDWRMRCGHLLENGEVL